MAVITIDRVWLQDPKDWTRRVVCGSNDRNEVDSVAAEVRSYANGRRRLVSSSQSSLVISIRLTHLTEDEKEFVRENKGRVMLYRDRKGTRVFGMYPSVTITTYKDNVHYDVAIEFSQVTYNEAV